MKEIALIIDNNYYKMKLKIRNLSLIIKLKLESIHYNALLFYSVNILLVKASCFLDHKKILYSPDV